MERDNTYGPGGIVKWFEERYDIDGLKNLAKAKLVPSQKYEC